MKYALDTNIYVDAVRDPAAETALLRFLERALPFTFLSAVVMQELSAGARTRAQAHQLDRFVFRLPRRPTAQSARYVLARASIPSAKISSDISRKV